MTHSDKTLRLYNIDQGGRQLNIQINKAQFKSAPRLRRGVNLMSILIPPGRFYDVCKELGVDYNEAQRVIRQSPQVKAHENAKRLLIREHPPSEETLAKEAAEQEKIDAAAKKMAQLNDPADEHPPSIPSASPEISEPVETQDPTSDTLKTEDENSEFDGPTESDLANEEAGDTESSPALTEEEPSMEWSIEKLRDFAERHDIDLGRSTSRTAILKKIRRGMPE